MNRRAFLRFLGLAPVALPVLASMPAAEPSIDFSEGMSPGAVNNSARAMMAALSKAWSETPADFPSAQARLEGNRS